MSVELELNALLPHVLDQCNVTWELDEQEQRHFTRMITDAVDYFQRRTGPDLDVTQGNVRALVINRVFYDFHRRLEWFENNYQNEISELLLSYAAMEHALLESEANGDY